MSSHSVGSTVPFIFEYSLPEDEGGGNEYWWRHTGDERLLSCDRATFMPPFSTHSVQPTTLSWRWPSASVERPNSEDIKPPSSCLKTERTLPKQISGCIPQTSRASQRNVQAAFSSTVQGTSFALSNDGSMQSHSLLTWIPVICAPPPELWQVTPLDSCRASAFLSMCMGRVAGKAVIMTSQHSGSSLDENLMPSIRKLRSKVAADYQVTLDAQPGIAEASGPISRTRNLVHYYVTSGDQKDLLQTPALETSGIEHDEIMESTHQSILHTHSILRKFAATQSEAPLIDTGIHDIGKAHLTSFMLEENSPRQYLETPHELLRLKQQHLLSLHAPTTVSQFNPLRAVQHNQSLLITELVMQPMSTRQRVPKSQTRRWIVGLRSRRECDTSCNSPSYLMEGSAHCAACRGESLRIRLLVQRLHRLQWRRLLLTLGEGPTSAWSQWNPCVDDHDGPELSEQHSIDSEMPEINIPRSPIIHDLDEFDFDDDKFGTDELILSGESLF